MDISRYCGQVKLAAQGQRTRVSLHTFHTTFSYMLSFQSMQQCMNIHRVLVIKALDNVMCSIQITLSEGDGS